MQRRFGLTGLLALILSALLLAGCGGGGSEGPGPKEVADQYLKAITSADWEAAEKLAAASAKGALGRPEAGDELFVNVMMSKTSYKLGDAKVQGSNASIDLELTMPDMMQVTERLMAEVFADLGAVFSGELSNEELEAQMTEKFEAIMNDLGDIATATYKGTMTLVKESGGWKVRTLDVDVFND